MHRLNNNLIENLIYILNTKSMKTIENIFKIGDKVFCYNHGGWGKVINIFNDANPFPIYCSFDLGNCNFTKDGRYYEYGPKILSFTEYTLDGFSQERPEELPEKGDIVWTRAEFPSQWEIGHFFEKKGNNYLTYLSPSFQGWTNEGIEITTTNPYEDEHTKEDEKAMVGNK